jgi:peptidoglycan/LPS O-acetylase OafA/YrhL
MRSSDVADTRQRHLPILDGVRALSIMLVVAGHWAPLGPKVAQLNGAAASMGMVLFFILSGFLITQVLESSNDLIDFLIKRLARILPLAFLYMAVVYVLFSHDANALFREMTFTLNYHPEAITPFNAHLWSLCVEVQFYMIAGLVFSCLRRPAPLIVLALCGLVTLAKISAGDAFSMQAHLRGDELLAGSLLYLSINGEFGDHGRFWRGMERLTPLLLILLVASCNPLAGPLDYCRAYVAAALVGALLFTRRPWLSRLLGSQPMRYVARISYAVYVIHIGAAAGVAAMMGTGSKLTLYLIQRPIAGAATWGLAHLSSFYYERPLNELGRTLIRLRHGSPSGRPSPYKWER